MSDRPSNPDVFHLVEGDGMGFDDDGQAVPVEWPEHGDEPAQPGGLEIEQVLDFLATGAQDVRAVGERVVILSFLMPRCTCRPQSLRELGARLGVSHETARKRLDSVRASFAKEIANLLPER